MTTAVLRPDATIAAGGAAYTGGASWTAVTADDSDATYATLAAASYGQLSLTTVTLPAGARTKTARVRMRIRANASAANALATVYTAAGSSVASVFKSSQSTTIATISGTTTSANLTQADVTGLWLQVSNSLDSGRWVELYVDLVYATIPTCTVTAPSGTYTTTSRPAVTWTHTAGSDGGPQARYRVVIYTAAQYGIGGFEVGVSPSTYDSGVLSGATVSLTPPSLPNAVYRVYVATAQLINGANHWSSWDNNDFTVSSTGPSVASVTPTANNTTASIAVAVARNTGGPAWEWVTVERSADAGTTWEFVRGASTAVATGNTFNVTDYEAPHSTSVTYRARATLTDAGTGALIAGAWVSSSSTSWTNTTAWVKGVDDPTANVAVTMAEAPEFEYPRRVGVFDVLGAEHAVTVADVAQSRRGTILLQSESVAEITDVRDVLDATPVLVQFPTTWGIDEGWFAVTGYTCRHLDPVRSTNGYRRWDVSVIEVDRPPDTTE